MEIVQVDLGQRSYQIEIGTNLLEQVGAKLAQMVSGRQAAIITDSNVGPLYAPMVETSLQQVGFQVQVLTIPAGEGSKSWDRAEELLAALLAAHFHRDSTIIALGGGVVGDLAGFVASIYQRGVHFVQVPTSLLAQVDSSVGGKVAVNHALGKNMIGSFYQPLAVWIDLAVLDTLPERHWKNGLAEVIKYGVIADKDFFCFLQQQQDALVQRQRAAVTEMIARCCRQKAVVVALDEKESGERAKLNYGHTIGHGIELAGHYQGYLHGEAVAAGMVLAARLAAGLDICSPAVEQELTELLLAYDLPVAIPDGMAIQEILEGMELDKKVQDGQWVFVLPEEIGRAKIVKGIARARVQLLLEGK